jgi:hypothetical protein
VELTVNVLTTPSRMRSDFPMVFAPSKRGSLSSCKSLLYVEGIPFIVMRNPESFSGFSMGHLILDRRKKYARTWPNVRPDLPRSNSRESGFFFCGMMLDPVLQVAAPFPVSFDPARMSQDSQRQTRL